MNMRKTAFSLLIALFTLSACTRDKGEISFRMKYEANYVVESSVGINVPFTLQTPPMQSNSEQAFRNNNTNASLVSSITMDYAQFAITAPANSDFSFLESVKLVIKADGLEDKTLAELDPVPANAGNTIVLNTNKANFKDYLLKDEFSLSLETVTDEFRSEDQEFRFNGEFLVKADVLN